MNDHRIQRPSCAPFEGDLSAYIDGELPSHEARALESHLASCPSCPALLEDLRGVVAGVGALPGPSAPHDLADRVMAEVRRPAPVVSPAPGWLRWGSLTVAASLLLVFTLHLSGVIGGPRSFDLRGTLARRPADGAAAGERNGMAPPPATTTSAGEYLEDRMAVSAVEIDELEAGLAKTREQLQDMEDALVLRSGAGKAVGGKPSAPSLGVVGNDGADGAPQPSALRELEGSGGRFGDTAGLEAQAVAPAQAVYLSYSLEQQPVVDIIVQAQQRLALLGAEVRPGDVARAENAEAKDESGFEKEERDEGLADEPKGDEPDVGFVARLDRDENSLPDDQGAVFHLPPVDTYGWAEALGADANDEGEPTPTVDLVLTEVEARNLVKILQATEGIEVQTYDVAPPANWGMFAPDGTGGGGQGAPGRSDLVFKKNPAGTEPAPDPEEPVPVPRAGGLSGSEGTEEKKASEEYANGKRLVPPVEEAEEGQAVVKKSDDEEADRGDLPPREGRSRQREARAGRRGAEGAAKEGEDLERALGEADEKDQADDGSIDKVAARTKAKESTAREPKPARTPAKAGEVETEESRKAYAREAKGLPDRRQTLLRIRIRN